MTAYCNNSGSSQQGSRTLMPVSCGRHESIFDRFELDRSYGFLTNVAQRTIPLPCEFQIWEDLGSDLPALTATGRIRPLVDSVMSLGLFIHHIWTNVDATD